MGCAPMESYMLSFGSESSSSQLGKNLDVRHDRRRHSSDSGKSKKKTSTMVTQNPAMRGCTFSTRASERLPLLSPSRIIQVTRGNPFVHARAGTQRLDEYAEATSCSLMMEQQVGRVAEKVGDEFPVM